MVRAKQQRAAPRAGARLSDFSSWVLRAAIIHCDEGGAGAGPHLATVSQNVPSSSPVEFTSVELRARMAGGKTAFSRVGDRRDRTSPLDQCCPCRLVCL